MAPATVAVSVLSTGPLVEGVLLKRYKRFLADVALDDGRTVTAHCPNTGPMTGVLLPGGRVRLRHDPSPSRKLAWTWEQAEVVGHGGRPVWVGVNTALPNRLVRATIEAGCLEPWLGPIAGIRAEVPYGEGRRSRIDLLLTPAEGAADPRPIYVEVKNTTWSDGDLALFPDTVTERGQKHLVELTALVPAARAVLVPCLSRGDVTRFAPGDSADPRPIYMEVKNTTWSDGDLALFPDTVTERGQKHLVELTALVPAARAVLVPCLSRGDVTRFAPGDSADPRYGELFRAAAAAGVEVLPCRYRFEATSVTWLGLAAQAW